MPTLSVVIPTKNEEGYLPRLLASIKDQSLQPDEIIVADAGSTDDTVKIAKKYGAKVVEGGLPGAGRNKGAEASTGELLFFFDADVELRDSEFIKRAVNEMERRKLDMATTNITPIEGKRSDSFMWHFYNKYARVTKPLRPHAPGFCLFARRELHEKIGGFDETITYAEDMDYVVRGVKEGRFGLLNRELVIHVSTRRHDRDGRVNMLARYLLAEAHMVFLGPIRHDGFNYTFGYSKKK